MDLEQNMNQYQMDSDQEKQSLVNGLNPQIGFIRKVYGILTTQLAITTIFCALAMSNENFQHFMYNNTWLFYICMIASIIIVIVLSCFRSVARTVPTNYILLITFTLCESYMVAMITTLYDPKIVVLAAALTTALFIGLTIYAFYTKTDFSVFGAFLFAALCVMIFASILQMFIQNQIFHTIICVCGVILFSIYVIYDTQLIMGNKQYSLDTDDYIIAALNLYLDFIQLFLYILQLLGDNR